MPALNSTGSSQPAPYSPSSGEVPDGALAGAPRHRSGDDLLTVLSSAPTALGRLVEAYPGRAAAEGGAWLDNWFRAHATELYERMWGAPEPAGEGGSRAAIDEELGVLLPPDVLASLVAARGPVATTHARIVSVRPHWFRGFRQLAEPVNVQAGLVVFFGPNSAGKTSLAEALEWLFSGTLARRAAADASARELERCVGNQFRPAEESTWVEATFALRPAHAGAPAVGAAEREGGADAAVVVAAEQVVLRRTLVTDYGATQTSTCVSVLSRNGVDLSAAEERALLASLFGGVPPLLMQHTLRNFVQSSPSARRGYFEQLLRLDELTHLIEKAVVTAARLPEFPAPTGGSALRRWGSIKSGAQTNHARAVFRAADRARGTDVAGVVRDALLALATSEFRGAVPPGLDLPAAAAAVEAEQRRVRQQQFPLLSDLRPQRAVDASVVTALSVDPLVRASEAYVDAMTTYASAREAAADIGESQVAIARAFAVLAGAGLIDDTADVQVCPICAQDTPPRLNADRRRTVNSWSPVANAVSKAEETARSAAADLLVALRSAYKAAGEVLPNSPADTKWSIALAELTEPVATAAASARVIIESEELGAARKRMSALGTTLRDAPVETSTSERVAQEIGAVTADLDMMLAAAVRYAAGFSAAEQAVGTQTTSDPAYAFRAQWLLAVAEADTTASELYWEHAKSRAQKTLEAAREELKSARQHLLETRRVAFSDGMAAVWGTLRKDTHSSFKGLVIPEPTARGFPVEIQVKATLGGGGGAAVDVDALRVFSESQVNVLGIAAYITRAKLLGHRMVVFDDPVQSMDEDHFRTFARGLLEHLLAEGFQVLLLTHNETFDKDVSFVHSDRDDYVTLRIRNSKRDGCQVDEGNRRVTERLAQAERLAEHGDLEQAWVRVRYALERLYTLVRLKHGAPGFEPRTWAHHAADAMWREGVAELVTSRVPDAGPRLRDILALTVGGAHDAPARGVTDLLEATAYIRGLLTPLRIGG
jgi:hypothetical protein